MKKIILASLLTLFAASASQAALVVSALAPSTFMPTAGQSFFIDLQVSGNTDQTEYLGFGLNYLISTAGISLLSALPDASFGSDLGLGNPLLSAVVFPGVTAGNFTLARFTFTANTVGPVTFSVSSDINDLNQGLFPLQGPSVDLSAAVVIDVQPGSAVPEPSTFAGSAAALCLGLYLLRR